VNPLVVVDRLTRRQQDRRGQFTTVLGILAGLDAVAP
jgi:hypothetical protein